MSCYHSIKDGKGKTNRIHNDDEEEEKIMIEKNIIENYYFL